MNRFGEGVLLDLGEGLICFEKEDGYTVVAKDRVEGNENDAGKDIKAKDSKEVKDTEAKDVKDEKVREEESANKDGNHDNSADPPTLAEEEEDAMDTRQDRC